MAKKTIKQRAEAYLKRTGEKQVYASADGFLFKEKQYAKAHANGLKDSKVSTYKLGTEKPEPASDEQKEKESGGKEAATQEKPKK